MMVVEGGKEHRNLAGIEAAEGIAGSDSDVEAVAGSAECRSAATR